MTDRTTGCAILHVGAPKCGSSALQSALTLAPDHRGSNGQMFRYVGTRSKRNGEALLYGHALRMAGARSAYGYVSWKNHVKMDSALSEPVWAAMHKAIAAGNRSNHIPILSCEGWLTEPELFAQRLALGANAPIDVVAFVRPPLAWLNAAYWQWGIWSGLPFGDWYARSLMRYRFGAVLQRWAAQPGVHLSVFDAKRDAVQAFANSYGFTLNPPVVRNSGASTALIGFLFRNRRFRRTAHDSMAEFVVQRWCPPVPGAAPWALTVPDVQEVRGDTVRDVRLLLSLFDPAEAERIAGDPFWMTEVAYHPRIAAGTPGLRDPSGPPALFVSLCEGVQAVSKALGRRVVLPPKPGAQAGLEDWDGVLGQLMEMLLESDRQLRVLVGAGLPDGLIRLGLGRFKF